MGPLACIRGQNDGPESADVRTMHEQCGTFGRAGQQRPFPPGCRSDVVTQGACIGSELGVPYARHNGRFRRVPPSTTTFNAAAS